MWRTECGEVGVVLVEQQVAGVVRHEERESEAAEIEEVLHWVHGQR